MAIGVSSDLANLAIALRIIYPQTTPEGQAFLALAQERLLAYADQVKHMECGLQVPESARRKEAVAGYTLV